MSRSSMSRRTQEILKGCEVSERRDMTRRKVVSFKRALDIADSDWRPATSRTRLVGLQSW